VSLALDDSLRRGAEVVLFPGEPREIHLLSVHLKSGCSRKPLDSGDHACSTLARQVPFLADWIEGQARVGHRFAVLGDFNRELLSEPGPARSASGQPLWIWPEIGDGHPPGANLTNAASGAPFRNCVPGQPHSDFIDHIVLGPRLAGSLLQGSFERLTFSAADARHARLSDHCPVAVRLQMQQISPGRLP
jgi:endonuclease/exonuclease/phosphatase family metal-dependent hydrolase